MKIILTGGGTGGHIYPALAVAKYLIARDWQILYLGSRNSLEEKLINAENMPFSGVDVSPLPRKISFQVISSLANTAKGFFQARKLIKQFNPDIVLGTGGFVAGPVVLAATLLKVPTIIHEQNVFPGITNKLLSHRVDKIALNFAGARQYLSPKVRKKTIVTGNPIRESILHTKRQEGLKNLELNDNKQTLLVFGGSQGAESINQAMIEILKYLNTNPAFQVIHLTGMQNYNSFLNKIQKLGIEPVKVANYRIIPYLEKMEYAYAVADLIVSRAGATGIAEITAKGIPAILIPYPYAAENHQEYNARNLTEKGAAVMIKDANLTGDILLKQVKSLLDNGQKLDLMRTQSLKLGQPKALTNIINLVEKLV